MVVFNDTPMEEGSGVFFLTAHFVIPVFSHPWLVFSPISSLSLTSLSSHLTQVIPDYSLSHHSCYHSSHTQCSHTHPHSLHSPSHLIVIPGYSLPSLVLPCSLIPACSHITPTTTHSHECSHTECSHTHRHPWLLTHTTRLTLTHSSPRSLSPHFSECSHPSLVFSHSPSHIECHHTHSHILLTCVTTLSDLTSLVFWESVCSHFHGVVLPPSLLSHCLLSHTLSHPCHPCEHFHGVVLPPSLPTHSSERTCAPTHTPMVSYYHQVITHTHTNPCAPTHSHLPCPHTLCSPHFISPHSHYKCITNASQMHHQPSPTLSHPSCLHHLIITSSPLPITYHHQSLPLTPHNTPNPSISLPTLPIVS